MTPSDLPTSGLVLLPSGACLLTECARLLNRDPVVDMRHIGIVLPTRRMGLHLLSALAKHHGAIIPPVMTTFDDLLVQLSQALDVLVPVTVSPRAVETFLAHELEQRQFRHVRPGMEHEFAYFLSEAIESGLDGTIHDRVRDIIQRDIYRSDEQHGALHERLDELKLLEASLRAVLVDQGLTLAPSATRTMAEAIAAKLAKEPKNPLPFKRLELIGFTTVAKVYFPLLQLLVDRPDCRVWLNESPLDGLDDNPLAELRDLLKGRRATHTPSYEIVRAPATSPSIPVHECPGILDETRAAVALARDYIDQGIDPSRIGLILPDEQLYAPLLKPLLAHADMDANLSMGDALAHTMFGQWIHGLAEVLASGEESLRVLSWMVNPITLSWLDTALPTEDSIPLDHCITHDLCLPDAGSGLDQLAHRVQAPRVKASLVLVRETLRGWLDEDHPQPRPLLDWVESLKALTISILPLTSELGRQQRRAFERLFLRLDEASALCQRPVRRTALFKALRDHALTDTLPPATDALSGVQVLSLAESRGVPFSVAIVLGCTEGTFPRAIPADTLLDNYLKTAAGLSGVSRFERLEDMTFGLLAARIPRLHLFHATESLGEAKAKSRFIERLKAENRAILVPFQRPGTRTEQRVAFAPASGSMAIEGQVSADDRSAMLSHMSATALERLIRCPYSFLLHRLGMKSLDLPQTSDSPRDESRWLHAILEAFFTGDVNGHRVIDPWPRDTSLAQFRELALKRLETLTAQLAPKKTPRSLLIQLRELSWPRFVDHWQRLLDDASIKTFGRNMKEVVLRPVVRIADMDVTLDGRFDSIDFISDMTLISDYKRRHVPDNPDVGRGISPQLAYYAITLKAAFPDDPRCAHEASVLGYWSILDGEWSLRAAGSAADSDARRLGLASARARPNVTEKVIQRVTELWTWRHQLLMAPDTPFAADPSHCEMCPYAGVCRKDDPVHMERIKSQSALKRQLTLLSKEVAP